MKRANLFKTGASLVALALAGCAGNAQNYPPKPIEQKPKVTMQVSTSKQETPVQKAKRAAMDYVKTNGVNLSTLEQGENITDLYMHGYTCGTGFCIDQFVITDKSYPAIIEIDGLMIKLRDLRLDNYRNILNIRGDNYRKRSDKKRDFNQVAKDSNDNYANFKKDSDEYMIKFGQNITDTKYLLACLDKAYNGIKYSGKQDHMITGKEAQASAGHLRQYLESRMKQENQGYQAKLAEVQRRK